MEPKTSAVETEIKTSGVKESPMRILPADDVLFGPAKKNYKLACCTHCQGKPLLVFNCGAGLCAVCSNCNNHAIVVFKPSLGQKQIIQ